jgi:hypothetical protein
MRRQSSHRGEDRFEVPPFDDAPANREHVKAGVARVCLGFRTVRTPQNAPIRPPSRATNRTLPPTGGAVSSLW